MVLIFKRWKLTESANARPVNLTLISSQNSRTTTVMAGPSSVMAERRREWERSPSFGEEPVSQPSQQKELGVCQSRGW